jgi:hypothetical protein
VLFKIGFAIPVRSKRLTHFAENLSLNLNPTLMQVGSVLLVTTTTLFFMFTEGLAVLDDRWGTPSTDPSGAIFYLQWRIAPLFNYIAVAMYGMGWPDRKSSWRTAAWIGAVYILIFASIPMASRFSRGTGLIPLFMIFGYAIRHRRIPIVPTTLAVLFLFYAGHTALSGRAVHGHYAGVLPYVSHLFSPSFEGAESITSLLAGDSLTPLTVSMTVYYNSAFVDQLSPLSWYIFQLPIPHLYGIGGTYTMDLTHYLGGFGTWGYTAGMFGDTFIHLGWWGCLPFLYMGLAFRFLENAIRGNNSEGLMANVLGLATLPVAYAAMAYGCFSTFRSWNSAFTFGIALVIIMLWVLRGFTARKADERGRSAARN